MARVGRASVLSIALLLATVAAGFLGGVAWQRGRTVSAEPEEPAAEEPSGRRERRLVIDEVGLEPGRRAEVEAIVQHFLARKRELDEEFEDAYQPRMRELYRSTRDSIKSVLSPEQRAFYDSLLAVRYGHGGSRRDSASQPRGGDRRKGGKER